MKKYRLTNKGKVVIAVLCTILLLFIITGGSLLRDKAPTAQDYDIPDVAEKPPTSVVPEVPPVIADEEEPWRDQKVTVFFEANKTGFEASYEDALNLFVQSALEHKDVQIQIEGNCATIFSNLSKQQKSINYNISQLRAQAIANYLANKGIGAEKLIVVANGSDKPLKDNSSAEGRKLNRRVDVFFVNK